jgi:hypothetical protein
MSKFLTRFDFFFNNRINVIYSRNTIPGIAGILLRLLETWKESNRNRASKRYRISHHSRNFSDGPNLCIFVTSFRTTVNLFHSGDDIIPFSVIDSSGLTGGYSGPYHSARTW